MDFHVITPRGSELIIQIVDDQLVIVPPVALPASQLDEPRSKVAMPTGG
ncbi:hypothetical protein ACEN9H_23325 [Massilia cellulosiltytica]